MEEERIINTEEKKESPKKKAEVLPFYEDIAEKLNGADDKLRLLLMELLLNRALKDDKALKKKLACTFDNRRAEDGSVLHLVGYYLPDQLSERDADDYICRYNVQDADVSKMWVIDKYGYLAELLK